MADLSRPDDRGQLILVAGFVLALTFVALALILNSVIFTENLATRSESVGGSGAIEARDAIQEGVGELMAYANANNNTGSSAPVDAVSEAVRQLDNATGPQYAVRGKVVTIAYDSSRTGTRYVQSDRTRNFTSTGGAEDWRLDTNVQGVRDFGLNVTRTRLADAGNCPTGECFRVNVSNSDPASSETWGVAIGAEGNAINVSSYNETAQIGSCTVVADHAEINLTTGWVGDTKCQALDFGNGISPGADLNVSFENADEVAGRYSLITTNTTGITSKSNVAGPGSGDSPRATYAVYSVTVDLVYATDDLTFDVQVRIAPGEPS